jgi:tol-pal system protein YbgF
MNDSYKFRSQIDQLNERTAGAVQQDTLTAVRDSQAEINTRLSEISMNLQELRGRFEENKYFLDKQFVTYDTERELLKAQLADINRELFFIKNKLGITEIPAGSSQPLTSSAVSGVAPPKIPDSPGTSPAGIPAKVPEQKDMTNAYEASYKLFKEKKYAAAREQFENFIKDYPDSTLTDNAHFWIAETYYSAKDYEGAILAYEELLKKYPASEKTGGALLKQGFAFIALGDKKTGRIILEKLVEKFPDSKEADLARKKL